ncbi:MAG: hypothetical protein F6K54_02015 [Okeania sp. SIO3B5]|nr:hypothetical protein [Okeania sp. SIO3B5]NEO51973.1 hypothetical protein [Okeania sp. SIO3B5]
MVSGEKIWVVGVGHGDAETRESGKKIWVVGVGHGDAETRGRGDVGKW